MKNYWCYRIDTNNIQFFKEELHQGKLRQGWGYDEGQDLREFTVNEGAKRNLPMFNKVKKGDILLVPQLPEWGMVALVEATEDWDKGYEFIISEIYEDYGHIFPAKFIKSFVRYNENVSGNLRSTLKNPSRFWNINHYAEDVERLLNTDLDLEKAQSYDDRLESAVQRVFDEKKFSNLLYEELNKQFTREEWEYLLVSGLKTLFPFYNIERVGGVSEAYHGTDILITMPSINPEYQYAIAVQVKDYWGAISDEVIRQINKAESYYNSENLKLIDKIVIITKAEKENNKDLIENNKGVRFIFARELQDILTEIGKIMIGNKINID